jgi:hypothetical protein
MKKWICCSSSAVHSHELKDYAEPSMCVDEILLFLEPTCRFACDLVTTQLRSWLLSRLSEIRMQATESSGERSG